SYGRERNNAPTSLAAAGPTLRLRCRRCCVKMSRAFLVHRTVSSRQNSIDEGGHADDCASSCNYSSRYPYIRRLATSLGTAPPETILRYFGPSFRVRLLFDACIRHAIYPRPRRTAV